MMTFKIDFLRTVIIIVILGTINGQRERKQCHSQEAILPCKCSQREDEIQIWCSHSDLPRVLQALKSIAKQFYQPDLDELILENNQLLSLPGRFFAPLNVMRLMLRHNGMERLSSGWLNDLGGSLVEIFIVERNLRSLPMDSLMGLQKLEAITIQSENIKRIPDFSGLAKLRYINVKSIAINELSTSAFRNLISLETVQITGSNRLNRLEAGLFQNLPRLQMLDLSDNEINWTHLRAMSMLPKLKVIKLTGNKISDAGMIGRALKDINSLEVLKLDRNVLRILGKGSFVDLPSLRELHLNDNAITEIYHGAFHKTPNLKLVHLENNYLTRVHPESFLQASGSGVEILHLQHNELARVEELRSLLDALPMLKYLDLSQNYLQEIPFGALRGHGTLEQLYLNENKLRRIERDALMAMPALRELRLRNNSLSDALPMPFWNLPGLKGLDLSLNKFRRIDPSLLMGVPSLRRLDLSHNYLVSLEPSPFINIPLLETLNLSHNELSMIHPATFRGLDRLFEIDASYNNIQEMIPGLPRIIERISLYRNRIISLPTTPNIDLDLPNLRMLDIGANAIQRIPRSAFKSLSQLRYLSMAKNRLQSIDESSLVGLERLEVLNVQDNRLMALHEHSLTMMRDLRDLNVQGNRLEVILKSTLDNLPQLERLDLSRNNIVEMSPDLFRSVRSLRSLDLSNNNLIEIPDSLAILSDLREIDISFNHIVSLKPQILSSLRSLEELRAQYNKVVDLPQGTFRDMPVLQYLDLSSNELSRLGMGSIRNLPELQELALADNRLNEIGDRTFEELPNLQAVHLQQNSLRYISPNSFYRSPSIVYLNLSTNQFHSLDHVGLRTVRNLEVLDLSNNDIRRVTSSPFRGLDWLVELKLDDNNICKIQGEPFTSMPRLRVLTMRNNKMVTVSEPAFRNIRTNLAILDLDGNPLDCSCNLLWLRAWYQETDSLTHYPGPRCRDGTMLRETRISRSDCVQSDDRSNNIPLTNDHGDIFGRSFNIDSECDDVDFSLTSFPNQLPPLPSESEYFINQYVDYPINDSNPLSNGSFIDRVTDGNRSPATNIIGIGQPIKNLSNTILNYNLHKMQQQFHNSHQPGPAFTFFGLPIPSLNVGKLWSSGRDAKTRSVMGTNGRARYQIYRPDDPDLFKYVNRNDPATITRIREQSNGYGLQDMDTGSDDDQSLYRPSFHTPFTHPQMEKGGFIPMVSGSGGFTPIQNPYQNLSGNNQQPPYNNGGLYPNSSWPRDFQQVVPLITETSKIENNKDLGDDEKSLLTKELSKQSTNQLSNSLINIPSTSTEITHTTVITTISPLQSVLAEMNMTTNAPLSTTTQASLSISLSVHPLPKDLENKNKRLETNKPNEINNKGPWSNIEYDSSGGSLSALIAPGAEQNTFRPTITPMPVVKSGRSKIQKVQSPYHQTIGQEKYVRQNYGQAIDDNFADSTNDLGTTVVSFIEDGVKKSDMDWYYATYNNTTPATGLHLDRKMTNEGCKPIIYDKILFSLTCYLIIFLID